MGSIERRLLAIALAALCALSVWQSYSFNYTVRRSKIWRAIPEHLPTNLGLTVDTDRTLTIAEAPFVKTFVEETRRYNLSTTEGKDEWAKSYPHGSGSYRLAADSRAVFLAMFHQLHCVETFGKQVIQTGQESWPHLQHCLNYLREMALCRPDLTLEPGDFTKRDFEMYRSPSLHVCRDWEVASDILTRNWLDWYMNTTKSTGETA